MVERIRCEVEEKSVGLRGAVMRYGLVERMGRSARRAGVTLLAFGIGRREFRLVVDGHRDAITNMVGAIKEKSPDTFIETHVLYGFPSETREEFEKSFGLSQYFDSVIYFYYTERKNVKASMLPGKINADEMIYRTRRIMDHPSFTRDPDGDKEPQVLLGYGLSEAELLRSIRKSYPEG